MILWNFSKLIIQNFSIIHKYVVSSWFYHSCLPIHQDGVWHYFPRPKYNMEFKRSKTSFIYNVLFPICFIKSWHSIVISKYQHPHLDYIQMFCSCRQCDCWFLLFIVLFIVCVCVCVCVCVFVCVANWFRFVNVIRHKINECITNVQIFTEKIHPIGYKKTKQNLSFFVLCRNTALWGGTNSNVKISFIDDWKEKWLIFQYNFLPFTQILSSIDKQVSHRLYVTVGKIPFMGTY